MKQNCRKRNTSAERAMKEWRLSQRDGVGPAENLVPPRVGSPRASGSMWDMIWEVVLI